MTKAPYTPGDGGRRLAAIVFTDVAGYSARMQRDETGTLALVRGDFEKMRAHCAQHGGEVLKSTGDGLLLCFSSVVQAVACALQIQTEFAARPSEALQHRIGIHLGDVFREGGDVAGDGVNIAARLQTKARPGTICLSQSVYDAVKGKLPMQVESLGPQQFKNIAQAIPVWLATPAGTTVSAPARGIFRGWWLVGEVLLVAALLVFALWPKPSPGPAESKPAALPPPSAPVADRSIAVLPFTNMSDDKDSGYFADGVHEDLLTNLANISALKVISRTSVMQYRATTKTIRQIARELGVAYILEGSVRRAGNKVRVTGQLINAASDDHIWAHAYDGDLSDVFTLQSKLAGEIAVALQLVLSPRETKLITGQPTDNPAAYDLFLRARAIGKNGGNFRDQLDAVLPLLTRAVGLDPKFAAAWAQLAVWHVGAWNTQVDPTAARLALAHDALEHARRLAPDSFAVLDAIRRVDFATGDNAGVAAQVHRILELFPGQAESLAAAASLAWAEKRWTDALAGYAQALALDPRGTDTLRALQSINLSLRRYRDAEAITQQLRELLPPAPIRLFQFALISYWAHGSTQEVEGLLAQFTPEQKLSDPDVIVAQAQWAFARGEARDLIRLWEKTGPKFRFSYTTGRFERLSIAMALLKEGQPERARPLLEEERRRLRATLGNEKGSRTQQANLALTCALLGDATGAEEAIAAGQKLPALNGVDDGIMIAAGAWLGHKDSAITALAKAMREAPAEVYATNVHLLRHVLIFWPLQGDSRFEALLDDPANNAPLL
jgi:adenylate cyclase